MGSALPYIAVHYSILQCITVHCSALQYIAVHYSTLQCITVYCSTLQYIAVHSYITASGVQCSAVPSMQWSAVQRIHCIPSHRIHCTAGRHWVFFGGGLPPGGEFSD